MAGLPPAPSPGDRLFLLSHLLLITPLHVLHSVEYLDFMLDEYRSSSFLDFFQCFAQNAHPVALFMLSCWRLLPHFLWLPL